jgi:hypothetical protein
MITIIIITVALVHELIMMIIAKICAWWHPYYDQKD